MLRQTEIDFFNTINSVGSELKKFEQDAKSQEDLVFELFRLKKVAMAWFQVQGFLEDMNRESLKRSLTNLKTKGKLIKTKNKVTGTAGKPCYQYILNPIN